MSGFDQERAPLDDRRQSAREAALDAVPPGYHLPSGVLDGAIEVATQAKITPEIVEAYRRARVALNSEQAHGRPPVPEDEKISAGIAAAFRAAGFEVVE